jgi:hypothetical protein
VQKVAPQSRNATNQRQRGVFSRTGVCASRFANHALTIGICAALCDAMIGNYL